MISPELLKILRCPETHQLLRALSTAEIVEINRKISAGKATNREGSVVTEPVEGGFAREDGKAFYPIRRNLPVLLISEAIPL